MVLQPLILVGGILVVVVIHVRPPRSRRRSALVIGVDMSVRYAA
jgi:hypothetical protein